MYGDVYPIGKTTDMFENILPYNLKLSKENLAVFTNWTTESRHHKRHFRYKCIFLEVTC